MNPLDVPHLAGIDNESVVMSQIMLDSKMTLLMGICSHLFMLKTGLEMMVAH